MWMLTVIKMILIRNNRRKGIGNVLRRFTNEKDNDSNIYKEDLGY